MSYVDGFVTPVPNDRKDDYCAQAGLAWSMFKEFGATRQVECWGDDIPDGKLTDFRLAVQAVPGETVVLSWIEYPSKAVRDDVMARMMADPRMKALGENMPFDPKRMIFGGFAPIFDQRS